MRSINIPAFLVLLAATIDTPSSSSSSSHSVFVESFTQPSSSHLIRNHHQSSSATLLFSSSNNNNDDSEPPNPDDPPSTTPPPPPASASSTPPPPSRTRPVRRERRIRRERKSDPVQTVATRREISSSTSAPPNPNDPSTPTPRQPGSNPTPSAGSSRLGPGQRGGGEGGDTEWAKALEESSGEAIGTFDQDLQKKLLDMEAARAKIDQKKVMADLGAVSAGAGVGGAVEGGGGTKMAGLAAPVTNSNSKLTANARLIEWLQAEGNVYLSEASGWGLPPHPMAISTETIDELTNESSGRGLLARRSVNEEDELLSIPLDLCLTKKSARRVLGSDVLDRDVNEYLAIACQLIHENFVQGEESFYRPYMNVLPLVSEVNPTFTWSDEDLGFLKGSPVVAATVSMQNKLKREYDALLGGKGGLCERFPDRFPREQFTFANWEWAFTMLFSRAIRLRSMKDGETLALVPYADLINHSPYSGAYLDARETGDWLFKSGGEEVILYADRGYRRMEQIYISYGPKSNADLLLLYGFALERNPYNSVDVTVSIASLTQRGVDKRMEREKKALQEECDKTNTEYDEANLPVILPDPLAQEKIAFLESVGRSETVDFPCYADRYPTELLQYLRLMMMTEDDTKGLPLTAFDYARTVSAANEAAVLTSIVLAIRQQLSLYPNTEEADADIIRESTLFAMLPYNQRMAVRHRRNEKRLLKRTIAALEKQIRTRGLEDMESNKRAEGSTLGLVLPGDGRGKIKQRTALEDRLEKMGLPVDIR